MTDFLVFSIRFPWSYLGFICSFIILSNLVSLAYVETKEELLCFLDFKLNLLAVKELSSFFWLLQKEKSFLTKEEELLEADE